MNLELNKKYLILDKSGFDSFSLLFAKRVIDTSAFFNFLETKKITPIVTKEAFDAGEFTLHSYCPNLFSGKINNTPDKTEIFSCNNDGTLTSVWGNNYNYIQVISATTPSNSRTQEDLSGYRNSGTYVQQIPLWESSSYWKKISSFQPDLSVVNLSRLLYEKEYIFSVLVNDWYLRQQLLLEGQSIIGSSALLAEMVLSDIISCQKGSFIYYNIWQQANSKFLPNKNNFTKEKYEFKEILQLARNKKQSRRNIFN